MSRRRRFLARSGASSWFVQAGLGKRAFRGSEQMVRNALFAESALELSIQLRVHAARKRFTDAGRYCETGIAKTLLEEACVAIDVWLDALVSQDNMATYFALQGAGEMAASRVRIIPLVKQDTWVNQEIQSVVGELRAALGAQLAGKRSGRCGQ